MARGKNCSIVVLWGDREHKRGLYAKSTRKEIKGTGQEKGFYRGTSR